MRLLFSSHLMNFRGYMWDSTSTKTKGIEPLIQKVRMNAGSFSFFFFLNSCFQREIQKLLSPCAFKRTLPSAVRCFGLYSSLSGAAQSSRTLAVHVMTRPNLLPHPLHWGSALCPVHLSVSCKWTLGHGSPSHGAPGGRSCSSRRPRTASETRRREL